MKPIYDVSYFLQTVNLASIMAKKRDTEQKEKTIDPRAVAIGKKLRKIREEKGYVSSEFFAWEHNIPRVGYWRLEKGTNFTIGSFLKVLDAHGITMKEFFSDLD